MDAFLTFLSNPSVSDIGSGAIVILVVYLIITGKLIPAGTHKREVTEIQTSRDAWKTAHTRSEDARQALAQQNFQLLETARISAKFYADFLPPSEDTQSRNPFAPPEAGAA
ncbi:hypothetical protein C5E11_03830 [Clavibacter michiganensis]|nr:hypothetical protein [Clavibacter michiganensis]PPF64531.1 hypothetical protein C5E11_03830 [Clavibacter michiganensis]